MEEKTLEFSEGRGIDDPQVFEKRAPCSRILAQLLPLH
jgi:hypothetical protein